MAFVHGKKTVITLDDSSGSPVDISQYTDTSSMARSIELATVTSFGDTGTRSIPGLENSTFSLSGSYDPALDAHLDSLVLKDTTSTLTFRPAGTGGSTPTYTAEVWVTSYNCDASVSDKTAWSLELQVDGNVTRS